MKILSASIASFFVSCTMLFALRPLAEVAGLIDKPGGRKTHHGDVPVVGGIAMFTGLLVAAIGGQGLVGTAIGLLVVAAFMVALGVLVMVAAAPAGARPARRSPVHLDGV